MKNFALTPEQLNELKAEHKRQKKRNTSIAYKINAVILLGTGWTLVDTSEALLLDEETLRSYVKKYSAEGLEALKKTFHQGRVPFLKDSEKLELTKALESKIYRTTLEIIEHVRKTFNVRYSRSGMTALLHELGFSYKKPKLVPSGLDAAAQEEFIECFENFLEKKPDNEVILFYDSSHPQYKTHQDYGWIKKGQDVFVPNQGKRGIVNISGAVDLEHLEVTTTFPDKVNAASTKKTFEKIEARYPGAKTIHIVLDNVSSHKSKLIKNHVESSKINLVFLPPYSPNLNLMERVWRLMYDKALSNEFFKTFTDFKNKIKNFFKKIKTPGGKKRWLDNLIVPEFQDLSDFGFT